MATLYVNPGTGSDSAAGSQSAPFKTITQALSQATAGTTIQLAAGTYNAASGEQFPLQIPQGVKVVGNESNRGSSIVIQGSGKFVSPTAAGQNVTVLMDQGAELRGVTVTNGDIRGTGVWIESVAATVASCTLTKCKREGVFATGTAQPSILSSVFVSNDAAGVIMAKSAKGEVRSNTFQNTGYGISLQDQSAPLIADNQILENRSGIVLAGEAKPILRKNRIEKNLQDGLTAIAQSLPDLGSGQDAGGNTFQGNGTYDLQNATGFKFVSVGNQLDPSRVKGLMDFSGTVVTPTPTPSPRPTPTPTPIPTPTPSPRPTPTPTPTPTGERFSDISGHWAKDFIERLAGMNIISGFPNGTFKPDDSLTRAQYAALLAKAFELTPRREATSFKDVAADFWAKTAIEKANRGGFMAGYPDQTFRPDQNLTRAQAIVSLINGLQLKRGTPNSLSVYSDRAQIPSYATEAVATATELKIVVNYPQRTQIAPMRDITRAEVSAFIYQTLVATGRAQAINSPYIV
ncbi:MAG: DUF1565 domain-containing protein [Actinomycetota bacterium]